MNRPSPPPASAQQRLRRIEGRHNALVKELRQAFARAERTEDGDCAIEGLRIVEEAIRSGLRFRAIFFKESAQNLAERLMPQIGTHVETLLLPDKLFDGSVPSETPQGVAALVRWKEFSLADVLERLQIGPVIVVVGLQDPGNLGTILRSAEAFGSAGVVLGEGTVSPFNSKVIRASAGSIFRFPVAGRKGGGRNGRDHGQASQGKRAPDRDFFTQGNGARSGQDDRTSGSVYRKRGVGFTSNSDGAGG